jgi:hypothetical protein
MRSLERNKQDIYYAEYTGQTAVLDANGLDTGSKISTYGSPVLLKINVSPAKGEKSTRQFGDLVKYDKVLCTTDKLPINEQTIFWIDDTDTSHPHDYEFSGIGKSLNSILYAVSKVKVSNA